MSNLFSTVTSWIGKEALAAVALLKKADNTVDSNSVEIDKLLVEGASVATLVPGVGPEVASVLNAGVSVLGAVKATLDGTSVVAASLEAQAPAGFSIVFIETTVKADLIKLFDLYKDEFAQAKTAVKTVATTTAPAPAPTTAG